MAAMSEVLQMMEPMAFAVGNLAVARHGRGGRNHNFRQRGADGHHGGANEQLRQMEFAGNPGGAIHKPVAALDQKDQADAEEQYRY